jgi:DNA modification methylase
MRQPEIRSIPARELRPAAYNPRVDLQPGDLMYEKLLQSVDEFGYVEPVIWNQRTGNIVGGHQRYKVLVQLGYDEIDCVVVDLDEQREKALNIALNKIQGDWEPQKLSELLDQLDKTGIGYDITGFVEKDVIKLWQEQQRQGKIQEDDFDGEAEAESIAKPISRPGDVWLLGKHRLLCGDSTQPAELVKLMDGAKARLIFTDPPWNVDYGGAAHPSWKQRTILNDKMSSEDFHSFLLSAFKAMASVSELGAMTYVVMSAQEWPNVHSALDAAGFHWSSTIIWAKDSLVLSRKDYHTQYEPIWFGWLSHPTKSADFAGNPGGGSKRLCPLADRQQSDLWQIPRPKKSEEHPTMKPIALAARAIQNSSHTGDAVLDPFGGSGTTLLAAEQTGRAAYLNELDPRYADVIVKRFVKQQESNAEVFLLRDGRKIGHGELSQT